MVAPVRESSAQALGSVFRLMSPASLAGCVDLLLQLLEEEEWQCRHGGLLAVKYLLATREDVATDLLPRLYPAVAAGGKMMMMMVMIMMMMMIVMYY